MNTIAFISKPKHHYRAEWSVTTVDGRFSVASTDKLKNIVAGEIHMEKHPDSPYQSETSRHGWFEMKSDEELIAVGKLTDNQSDTLYHYYLRQVIADRKLNVASYFKSNRGTENSLKLRGLLIGMDDNSFRLILTSAGYKLAEKLFKNRVEQTIEHRRDVKSQNQQLENRMEEIASKVSAAFPGVQVRRNTELTIHKLYVVHTRFNISMKSVGGHLKTARDIVNSQDIEAYCEALKQLPQAMALLDSLTEQIEG